MKSHAKTVEEYLEGMTLDRREAISEVRRVILDNLPAGYEETMNWGMISYEVPLSTYPNTYNKRPLSFAALGNQKNHMALYLNGVYGMPGARERFAEEYEATGKPLDMGASCVRFTKLADLPLDLIGRTIGSVEVDEFVALAEEAKSFRKR